MPESQRLDLVSDLQHDPRLKPEVVAFFKAEIADRSLGLVTRNNIANLLVLQDVRDSTLADVFRVMAEDRTEMYMWREYAVQHLASATDFSNDPAKQTEALWRMVDTGEESIPGTALLHLNYLEDRNISPVPALYAKRVGAFIVDDKAHLSTRMTCLGIVGQRMMSEQAPAVRELARNATQPSLKRTAIATLGTLGDPADLALVQGFTKSKDASIAVAAKGAERRLLAANQQSSQNKP
jgi:hypothetical protein